MKPIALSLCASLIAFAAAPALAGLDFTDRAVNVGGTADFRFNGSTAIGAGTSVVMNNGLNGAATNAIVSSTNGAGSLTPTFGAVEFQYNGFFNGVTNARYDTFSGIGATNDATKGYSLVIEFGAIGVFAGAGGFASLQSVEFKDFATGYSANVYNVNQAITNADANRRFLIWVPSAVPPGVALTDRDWVTAVRLTFLFTGGSSTSINVRAVANPEPGTVALFGLGALGLLGAVGSRRKKRLAAAAKQNA